LGTTLFWVGLTNLAIVKRKVKGAQNFEKYPTLTLNTYSTTHNDLVLWAENTKKKRLPLTSHLVNNLPIKD